ncbi:MAG TPA: glycoside hydrolase family 5 protein [Polyangiaceae bacterium]|nr:glycoside hydrolase family 5 protein [Polyangiaceae bacterium]
MQSNAQRALLGFGMLVLLAACDVGSTSAPGDSPATAGAGAGANVGQAGASAAGGVANSGSAGGGTAGESAQPADSAKVAAANMGKGFNLGQMFESTQHPPTLAAASAKIDAYYAKGFRTVRIPVTWTEQTNGDTLVNDPAVGDVNRAHPRLAVISQVIDHALSLPGMFVILNAHHEVALKTESRAAVLERLWADLSEIFAQRSHHLLFEILNEPHRSDSTPMPAADLRNMTAKAYAKIRAVDPARIVVIGGNQWFAAGEVPKIWTDLNGVGGGNDPYVMATFHHYDPWTFCGDSQGTYDDAWTEANISQPMDTMLNWANSVGHGMPVFIGEWGVAWGSRYDQLSCNNIRLWYQKLSSAFATPRGIPTTVWDDGGWFKIYDHDTDAFANNLIDCISGSCDWEGTERFNAGCL